MGWKTLNTTVIEANKHLRFFVDDFETDGGKQGKYFYHNNAHGDTAVDVFVQKGPDTFVMTREYRYLFDRATLAVPAGSVEEGESDEAAARREMAEECGYEAGTLIDLGWHATAIAFSKEKMHLFLAQDVKPIAQHLDELEAIEVVEMTAKQIDEAIMNGEMIDGCAIAAWAKIKLYLGL